MHIIYPSACSRAYNPTLVIDHFCCWNKYPQICQLHFSVQTYHSEWHMGHQANTTRCLQLCSDNAAYNVCFKPISHNFILETSKHCHSLGFNSTRPNQSTCTISLNKTNLDILLDNIPETFSSTINTIAHTSPMQLIFTMQSQLVVP